MDGKDPPNQSGFRGKRKRSFTRSLRSSTDTKDSDTRREYDAAVARGEAVPAAGYFYFYNIFIAMVDCYLYCHVLFSNVFF